jgi:hypothetical protein
MNTKDRRVVQAMGSKFEDFRLLAKQAHEQPTSREACELEMAKILGTMSAVERLELRAALKAAKS